MWWELLEITLFELYTLNGWILEYVKYISMLLFKKKKNLKKKKTRSCVGNSKLVLCDNLEEWDGEGGGRGFQEGGDMCIPLAN